MNTDNKMYLELLEDIAADCDGTVYENYSGRGMYGKECHGITGPNLLRIVETAGLHGLTGASSDSMGRDYIVYWQHPVFDDRVYEKYGEELDPN